MDEFFHDHCPSCCALSDRSKMVVDRDHYGAVRDTDGNLSVLNGQYHVLELFHRIHHVLHQQDNCTEYSVHDVHHD